MPESWDWYEGGGVTMVGVLFALSFGSFGMIMMGSGGEAEDTWGRLTCCGMKKSWYRGD